MNKRLPFNREWPYYSADEIDAVAGVLRSGKVNYWTGTIGREFEQSFAAACGCRYAVAVSNGTTALELALRSMNIGAGDDVVVPARTFIATAAAVVNCGARPVFADVDRNSQNVTAHTLRQALTPATRALIVVHLGGWPCEMGAIEKLARQRGLKIIEDCAQAHGARYKGRPVGSLGDAAAFSFCQDKIISTGGEGGMLVTNDVDIWQRAWSYKDHGRSLDTPDRQPTRNGFRWLHDSIGTNWRMTELQAAIGCRQLAKLPRWHRRRRRNAMLLYQRLRGLPGLRIPLPPAYADHAYYRFTVFVRPHRLQRGWDRDRILGAIGARGVSVYSGSCPEVYLERAFATTNSRPPRRLPTAKALGESSLSFPVHPTLGDSDMERTASVIAWVMAQATRRRAVANFYQTLSARARLVGGDFGYRYLF